MYTFVFVITVAALLQWTAAKYEIEKCGQLDENHIFNERAVTSLSEFPWIARVYYRNKQNQSLRKVLCLATLISKRHLLSPAHCFILAKEYKAESVLLGDSNSGNADNVSDCNQSGECGPSPKEYFIADIAVHPNFDWPQIANNIAVIHLTKEVELSEYIQPICMPPPSTFDADFQGQYFVSAGFLEYPANGLANEKVKAVMHVMPRGRCSRLYSKLLPDEDICTVSAIDLPLLAGSALMGFIVDNDELRSYYILGISHTGSLRANITLTVHTQTSRHINWILSNVHAIRK